VAEAVVDGLEAVDVEIDDAQRHARSTRPRALGFDGGLERAPVREPVREPSEAVVARQLVEDAMVASHPRDQRRDDQPACDLGEPAAQNGRAPLSI